MIVITGDTHGMNDIYKIVNFSQKSILGVDDYLVVAGDFGIWSNQLLEKMIAIYNSMPFTTLFVDGNHENFNILNSMKVTKWKGGKVHKITDKLIHLMRGQIYTIQNKTIFTFGGATSVDKHLRIENIDWWKEEVPSQKEFAEAKMNLQKVNNEVDYIITHTCDTISLYNQAMSLFFNPVIYRENEMLDYFEKNILYKHWYFGHFHIDADLNERKTTLYNTFRLLD